MKAFAIALALLGALSAALADSLRDQVEASAKRITAAMKKKDLATLTKEMKAGTTSDFKYSENGQTQTRDQMIQNMTMGLGMMKKITLCETKMLSLKQNGAKATGMMRHSMAGTMMGPDKKTHTMTFTGVSENNYVMQGGKWKMSSMTWKSVKQTQDGKPAKMGG